MLDINDVEREYWLLDQKINSRGLPVDLEMARGALAIWEIEKAQMLEDLSLITGMEKVTRNPFLAWLTYQGYPLENTQKDTIEQALKTDLPIHIKNALTLWSYKEVRALDKYKTILNTAQNGRLFNIFQYGGASRTMRWAGRVFQPHNLKRTLIPTDQIDCLAKVISQQDIKTLHAFWGIPPSELLGSAIRHAVCAPPGRNLVAADLSSIESRVLGWITNCTRINQVFAQGKDTYKDFASHYFGVHYDGVTPDQRKFSKPPVLGAGFGLGWRGMIAYAEGYGVYLDEEKAKRVVDTFRTRYYEVPIFWRWIARAVEHTTMTGAEVEGFRLKVFLNGEFLCIQLPSGRSLKYFRPQILPHETPWGAIKATFSYMGLDDKNQWVRLYVHPGLLTENIVQAIARDLLAYGMVLADRQGLDIILHVHDEVVIEAPLGKSAALLNTLIACMTTNPPWASDLMLGAQGYIAKRYRKD